MFALGAMLPLLAFGGEGDEMLANYLELKTLEIEDSFLGEVGNRDDWNEQRRDSENASVICSGFLPTVRTDLKATITGKLEGMDLPWRTFTTSPARGFTSRESLPARR